MCSGSGCIGLSVAKACPDVFCYLFEYYDKAFSYSQNNLIKLDATNARVIKHDVLSGPFDGILDADLIVSNPPYIETPEIPSLQEEVLREPVTALDGGYDGLIFYKAIYEKWTAKLSDKGFVAFECGENQSKDISLIYSDKFSCEIFYDSYGAERFVIGREK